MRRTAPCQKLLENPPSAAQLQTRDAFIFDEFAGAQLFNLAPHVVVQVRVADALHVQINEVADTARTAADKGWCYTAGDWRSRAADSGR